MSLLMVHCFGTIQERFDAQDEASSPRESWPAAASAGASAADCRNGERKSRSSVAVRCDASRSAVSKQC